MELKEIIADIADELAAIDKGGIPFKSFLPGVGPYGEPQLIRELSKRLSGRRNYANRTVTRRSPDLLIKDEWGIEFKIVRPFGDNGKQAENWSVNLLHPYPGNVSLIGDCLKLRELSIAERKAVAVIGYEHMPSQIPLEPLIHSFELLARQVVGIRLGPRIEITRSGLIHPVHQRLTVFAWQISEGSNK